MSLEDFLVFFLLVKMWVNLSPNSELKVFLQEKKKKR